MKRTLASLAFTVVLAVSCVSCDKLKPPLPELQKSQPVAGTASPQDLERRAFSQAAQKELDELHTAIGDMRARAKHANAQVQALRDEELARLDAQRGEVQQRLADLESATLENWGGLKQTFGSALEKLKAGVAAIRKSAN